MDQFPGNLFSLTYLSSEPDVVDTIIYDFGMNNGDDVAYYLKRAQRVIAVEANPELCSLVMQRFSREIGAGRLTILNVALSDKESAEPLPFYIHKTNHVVSQLPQPMARDLPLFRKVLIPQRSAESIINEFGEPLYIKIDVEHYDQVILRGLLKAGIFPDYISAESHSAEVFCLLVAMGYRCFNLVDGPSVAERYGFPLHSAGPFGSDISSPWYDLESFFYVLASARMGWKDIHASRCVVPEVVVPPSLKTGFSDHVRDLIPSMVRASANWKRRQM